MATKSFAVKRIMKDLKEIEENPLDGVGICMIDNKDPFQYLLNIKILQGRYADLIVHMILFLPQEYPCKPPRILILPGQSYDHSFHHHIYPDCDGYFKFCIDLLDEAIMNSNTIGSGWSPGYSFCTLFMQIQHFLSDPDFHSVSEELSDEKLQKIRNKMKNYSYSHTINGKKQDHSTKQPFPALFQKKQEQNPSKSLIQENVSIDQAAERLSCFMTKENIKTNPKGIFGYPIYVIKDKFGRLQSKPIPEIMSYEGFLSQDAASKISNVAFKTGMGEQYNNFIPIFINKEHFANAEPILKECLKRISSETYFEKQVIQVLPNLINKMLVALLSGVVHQSIASFEAYIHFTQLFQFLAKDNSALKEDVKRLVLSASSSDKSRNKQNLGDIGEFLVILSASQYSLTPEFFNLIYREYFARQIMWIPRDKVNYPNFLKQQGAKRLNVSFQSSFVSNKLLIFNIEAARQYADREDYMMQLANERYSVISEQGAEDFIKNTNKIINSISDHQKLFQYLGLGKSFPSLENCYEFFKTAICVSNQQGYTKFDINLAQGKPATFKELGIDKSLSVESLDNLIDKSEYREIKEREAQSEINSKQKANTSQNENAKVDDKGKSQSQIKKSKIKGNEEEEKKNDDGDDDDDDEWCTVGEKKQSGSPETNPIPISNSSTKAKKLKLVKKIVEQEDEPPKEEKQKDDGWSVVSTKKPKKGKE